MKNLLSSSGNSFGSVLMGWSLFECKVWAISYWFWLFNAFIGSKFWLTTFGCPFWSVINSFEFFSTQVFPACRDSESSKLWNKTERVTPVLFWDCLWLDASVFEWKGIGAILLLFLPVLTVGCGTCFELLIDSFAPICSVRMVSFKYCC